MERTPNYLASIGLTGPRIEDDVRRLILKYGIEDLQSEIKRHTVKRGRPSSRDWPELIYIMNQDARDFLSGLDPFALRTNYSIAQNFADKNPGHSHAATVRRIMRKLAQRREYVMLIRAHGMCEKGYPFGACLKTYRSLASHEGENTVGQQSLENAEGSLADYTLRYGPPRPDMSMEEIKAELKKPIALFSDDQPESKYPLLIQSLLKAHVIQKA